AALQGTGSSTLGRGKCAPARAGRCPRPGTPSTGRASGLPPARSSAASAHYNEDMQPLPRFLGVFLLAVSAASAQEWPARPVRIVVPFPAGGSADLIPRIVAEKLSEKWGQPVIVENRPGAAGNIGADIVFRAEPDGYTLPSAPPPPLVINRLLYPKLSYDSTRFVPISVIGAIPNVLLVHPKLGVDSVEELISLARSSPGKLNYASQGSGTTSHLTAELFKSMAGGLRITHIPYKGTAPGLTDMLGVPADIMFD